jgi:hypothetical protein
MTQPQAIAAAKRQAARTGEVRFVVYEAGEYHTASEFDLDTWFAGIRDENILFVTGEEN